MNRVSAAWQVLVILALLAPSARLGALQHGFAAWVWSAGGSGGANVLCQLGLADRGIHQPDTLIASPAVGESVVFLTNNRETGRGAIVRRHTDDFATLGLHAELLLSSGQVGEYCLSSSLYDQRRYSSPKFDTLESPDSLILALVDAAMKRSGVRTAVLDDRYIRRLGSAVWQKHTVVWLVMTEATVKPPHPYPQEENDWYYRVFSVVRQSPRPECEIVATSIFHGAYPPGRGAEDTDSIVRFYGRRGLLFAVPKGIDRRGLNGFVGMNGLDIDGDGTTEIVLDLSVRKNASGPAVLQYMNSGWEASSWFALGN